MIGETKEGGSLSMLSSPGLQRRYICGKDHRLHSLAKVPASDDLVAVIFILNDNVGEACR
jgi:hypothetical protein